MSDTLSVSDLTSVIKAVLEDEPVLQAVDVEGEVSNLTLHTSGHAYFTLKDAGAQVSCVMFRGQLTPRNRPLLKAGARLVVTGDVTVYAMRGQYQLQATALRGAGLGDLYQQFLQLRDKLKAEGLFDPDRKRPLPALPRRIGIVTSPTGAVIQDMLRVFERRFPCVEIVLAPATVQGDTAPASVLAALRRLEAHPHPDLILIARGGGSAEDLWAFNDEALVRAVAACPVPVMSAIGHDTDYTLLDFAADVRAATPTAAAELATPDRTDLLAMLDGAASYLADLMRSRLHGAEQFLDDFTERLAWQRQSLFQAQSARLDLLEARLQALDPRALLAQGCSVTLKDGRKVLSATELTPGDVIETVLREGRVQSVVK